MGRMRTVKPEFFTSEAIARIRSYRTRLTFIGLWTYVDDEGRGRDNALLIRAAVWPLEPVTAEEVEDDLTLLTEQHRIVRYTAILEDGGEPVRLLAVRRFKEHQRPNHPTKSKLPPPPPATHAHTDHHVHVRANTAEAHAATHGVREDSGSPPPARCDLREHPIQGGLPEDSGRAPGGLPVGVVVGVGVVEGGEPAEPAPPRCARHSDLPPDDPGPKCVGCRAVRLKLERAETDAAAAREAERRAARLAEQRAARDAPRPSGSRGPALARQILAEAKAGVS